MAHLIEWERIEPLMMIGYDDIVRLYDTIPTKFS